MTHESGSPTSTRTEVAPPLVTGGRLQRTGYAVLAASGLALATVFGTIAQAAGGDAPSAAPEGTSGSISAGGAQVVPGQGLPADQTRTISGVANAGPLSTTTPAPTTLVTIGPDGEPTTTTITPVAPPPANGGEPTSRSDDNDGNIPPTSDDGDDGTTPPSTSTTPPDSSTSSPSDTTPTSSPSSSGQSSTSGHSSTTGGGGTAG